MVSGLLFSKNKHLGFITLNKPESLNALSFEMIQSLQLQLSAWAVDPSIHAVIIKSAPGKAFCAGGDIRGLYALKEDKEKQLAFFWHEYRLNYFIHHYAKPYIALMDGITMGGGVGISLHGSHPVASERFIFAMPETGIGFFPDIGASKLLSQTKGQLAFYLGLTGNRLNAFEAKSSGLVFEQIASANFENLIDALAEMDLSSNAFEKVNTCLKEFACNDKDDQMNANFQANGLLDYKKIDHYFGRDSLEAILKDLNEIKEPWEQTIYKQLLEKSPLSLQITFRQLTQAQSLSLANCLRMDYILVSHFIEGFDFYEGVRALLIDKDKKPCWEYRSVEEVPANRVIDYFETTDKHLEFDFI